MERKHVLQGSDMKDKKKLLAHNYAIKNSQKSFQKQSLKNRLQKEIQYCIKTKGLFLLLLPGLLWFIIFNYMPLFANLVAFKNFRIFPGGFFESLLKSEWVGFDNFKFLFASSDTGIILRNTILYNLIFIVLNTTIPIVLAIAIKELLNVFFAKIYQSIMFFPYFLSWVVVSYFLFAFLDPTKGIVTKIVESMDKETINMYLTPKYWPFILIAVNVWKGLGYGTVLYLASIISINPNYYEASVLDGASKLQQIRYITLPNITHVIIILVILSISKILNSDFGLFYHVPRNSGALFSVTQTIDTYVYRALIGLGDIGMSSAAALFQSFIGFVLVIISNFIIRKVDNDSAFF